MMTVDNADSDQVMLESQGGNTDTDTPERLNDHFLSEYLPVSSNRLIVITSRVREAVEWLDVKPMEI